MILPTLLYHHVNDDFVNNITVTRRCFQAHLAWLRQAGYRSLTLAEAIAHVHHQTAPPPKSVLITFDDGYEDTYTTAFPLLQQYNFTAAVYPIIEAIGHWNEWNRRAPYIAHHLTWAQIEELHRHGIDIGCHTLTHHSLVRFDPPRIRHELSVAQTTLAERLNSPITSLSYPYGDHNATIRAIAAELFNIALAVDDGNWNWQAAPFAIRRLTVRPGTSPQQLAALLQTPFSGQPLAQPAAEIPDIKT